jgi:transcriptional regulator with XRE-family HTH domain
LLLLGSELRRLRASLSLSLDQAADRSGVDPSQISRLERAENRARKRTLTNLLRAYGVTDPGRQAALSTLLDIDNQPPWLAAHAERLPEHYRAYIGLEHSATGARNYESSFIPALLQTADYAPAVIRGVVPAFGEHEVNRLAEVRIRRQEVLHRPQPVQLWAVIDEAAIRREVGGPQIMRAQLRHLAELAANDHITLQIVPFDAGAHPGMRGPFVILDFGDLIDTALVYTDSMNGAGFLEATDDVDRYAADFEQIIGQALKPAASLDLILKAAA